MTNHMTSHDQFVLDSGFEGVTCPVCSGERCDECEGSGEVAPGHRKELLIEMKSEL